MVILRRKRWAFETGMSVMPVDLQSFGGLYEKLFAIDLTGVTDGVHPPLKTVNNVRAATAKGAPFLPLVYRQDFHQPLDAALPSEMSKLQHQVKSGEQPAEYMQTALEMLYGAVYQHGPRVTKVDTSVQLRRFLAIVSNLYRSFLDSDKRAAGVRSRTSRPGTIMTRRSHRRSPRPSRRSRASTDAATMPSCSPGRHWPCCASPRSTMSPRRP
jgi:hypothetical protein